MKKLIPVFVCVIALTALQANAQISILREDFPDIGNLVINAMDNTTTINPGQAGLNQTWDFSNLTASGYDSTYYIPPSQAPGHQYYPSANMATNHNPLSFPNGYNVNFWNYSSANILGIADESLVNLFGDFYLAFHIRYLPSSANMDFPIDYGDVKSQNFTIDWITASRLQGTTTDSARTISHVSLSCAADASGTMIIPDGSFPVLRVSENFNTIDSSFTWSGSGWVFNQTTSDNWTQYRWYAKDFGEVGFYGPGSKKANQFTFFKSETVVGIGDRQAGAHTSVSIHPNPATTSISITSVESVRNVEIYDQTGNLLKQAAGTTTMDVSDLASGSYLVRVTTGNTIITKKICKQ
jgi:hypothetical protein